MKVARAKHRPFTNVFVCTLACGHVVERHGRLSKFSGVYRAPRTATCPTCGGATLPPHEAHSPIADPEQPMAP